MPCCGIPCCGNTQPLVRLKCGHNFCVFCLMAQKKCKPKKPASMFGPSSPPFVYENVFAARYLLTYPLCSSDAYRSRKKLCKASVALRCALCRSHFLLWPSQLQRHQLPAKATPAELHYDSDSSYSSNTSDTSNTCPRHPASSSLSVMNDNTAHWKRWDLCWAKVGDWPFWLAVLRMLRCVCCVASVVIIRRSQLILFFCSTQAGRGCFSSLRLPRLRHFLRPDRQLE
jgi:hypothetical protein